MIFAKRFGTPLLAALAVWTGGAATVRAQLPSYLADPSLNLQQAAFNMALTGRGFGAFPQTIQGNYSRGAQNAAFMRYAQGYSPYSYGLGTTPYNTSAASLYANSLNNPYLSSSGVNPYANLYGAGAGYGGLSAMSSSGSLPTSAGAGYGAGSDYSASPYSSSMYDMDPYGGYLRGAASVITGQGKFITQFQQAKLSKEQAEQAKIETRRKLFDEIMYERAQTPSFTKQQEKLAALRLRRSQNTPSITEIWSGHALNILLKDLKALHAKKPSGPEIELSNDTLKQINIVDAKGKGNIGLLRNDGRLTWPPGLQELEPVDETQAIRRNLDALARRAVQQAANGEVDAGVLKDLRSKVQKLHRLLGKNVNDLPTSQYIEAKRYLNNFDDAVKGLASPNVANYFNQTWMAKGKTVQDLVDYMVNKGLTFAPAVSGDEGAYQALYSALAAYDLALRQKEVASRDKKAARK